jgi:hypothetical protein
MRNELLRLKAKITHAQLAILTGLSEAIVTAWDVVPPLDEHKDAFNVTTLMLFLYTTGEVKREDLKATYDLNLPLAA